MADNTLKFKIGCAIIIKAIILKNQIFQRGRISMKKVLAYICAAMLLFGAVLIPQTDIYAMTTVSTADEAVEKRMDALLALLDDAEIDESFTQSDLEDLLFSACNYTVNGFVGPAFMVEKFKIVGPSSGGAGYMSADVSIFLDDAEEALGIKRNFQNPAA